MRRAQQAAPTGSRPRYSVAEKLEIVQYAQTHTVAAACRRFSVARSSIYLWVAREDEFEGGVRERSHPFVVEANTASTTTNVTDEDGSMAGLARETNGEVYAGVNEDANAFDTESGCLPTGVHSSREHSSPTSPAEAGDHHVAHDFVLIGYQGTEGGFAQLSAQRIFMELLSNRALPVPAFELTGYPQASHVLDALQKNEIDYAFVATDVLLSSTHHAALDRLVASRLRMIGEVVSHDDVAACALPGTELCDVDCVMSDSATLERYEEYILHLEVRFSRRINRHSSWDSAAGCRIVQEEQAENTLVLCSSSAATRHGLVMLQRRVVGASSHTRYSVVARDGTPPLALEAIPQDPVQTGDGKRCTLLIKGTQRAILDVISAFAIRGLEIVSFHIRGGEDGHPMRSYVISYRSSPNPFVERGLQFHLTAASERVISLGTYSTYTL